MPQRFIGRAFPAADATLENLDQYRAALTKARMAPNQIGEHLKQVKLVYAWAERRESRASGSARPCLALG